MKRTRRQSYEGSQYPDLASCIDRRRFLAGLGAAAGAAALAPHLIGCQDEGWVGGIQKGPEPDTYTAVMPPAPDSRWLYMAPGGEIAYHLEVTVDELDLREWLLEESDALLDQVDELLDTHPVTDFAPGEDLASIEASITHLLEYARPAVEDGPAGEFDITTLVIDHYDEEVEIDGDVASAHR